MDCVALKGLKPLFTSLLHGGSYGELFSKFLTSDFYPTAIAIILFSGMLMDRDQTYTFLIDYGESFKLYEQNVFFKNYAGTSQWYILGIKDTLFIAIFLTASYFIKGKDHRIIIFLFSFGSHFACVYSLIGFPSFEFVIFSMAIIYSILYCYLSDLISRVEGNFR